MHSKTLVAAAFTLWAAATATGAGAQSTGVDPASAERTQADRRPSPARRARPSGSRTSPSTVVHRRRRPAQSVGHGVPARRQDAGHRAPRPSALVTADGTLSPRRSAGLPAVDARGQGGLLDVALDPNFATNG